MRDKRRRDGRIAWYSRNKAILTKHATYIIKILDSNNTEDVGINNKMSGSGSKLSNLAPNIQIFKAQTLKRCI